MLRRSAAIALAVVASLGASACGEKNSETQGGELAAAESEALYIDLGGLKYQVQLSRQLNPRDPTDKTYFQNVAPAESTLERGSIWFGVFMRVENESDKPIGSAEKFSIQDTQGNEFEPVESENTFAYRPSEVPGGGYIPDREALQAQAGTQGALLLFKIPLASLDNRPLELSITDPRDAERRALIDLDV